MTLSVSSPSCGLHQAFWLAHSSVNGYQRGWQLLPAAQRGQGSVNISTAQQQLAFITVVCESPAS
jgi:hypothetical protein